MRLIFLVPILCLGQTAVGPATRPAATQNPSALVKPEDLGTVEGRIIDAVTGDPIRKANLVLRKTDVSPGANGILTTYSGTSDDTGKFSMKEIPPGRYRLMASRNGYANTEYGAPASGRQGTTISIEKGQRVSGIDAKLVRHGVVSGRIVDADGDPVASTTVQVLALRYVNGKRQLAPFSANSTNDLGEYRVYGITPGRYYLNATVRPTGFEGAIDRSNADKEFAPTYYPGTVDSSAAVAVNIAAGSEVRIDMTLAKTKMSRISGRVVNTVAPEGSSSSIYVTPKGPFVSVMNSRPVNNETGTFELRGLTPGSYSLIAMSNFAGKSYTARRDVEVTGADIENVVLTIGPGMEVSGRVRVDGNTPPPGRTQIMLRPRETGVIFSATPLIPLGADGTFTLPGVNPDHYNLFFPGLPEGYFIKSARMGDSDVLANGVDLRQGGGGNLEIVISPNAGKASGSVIDPKTQMPVSGAMVVLVPVDKGRTDQSYFKTATTDQSGTFSISSISPGGYKVYAWDNIEAGSYLDPEFVQPFESKGEALTVRESSNSNLQLKVIAATQ